MLGALVVATLLAAGDIAACGSPHDEETAALVAARPGVVATLGDNVYDRWSCFSWARFRGRIRPAPGNHDYEVGGYAQYFGLRRTWYRYRLGRWNVFVLDTEREIDEQTAWLRREVARDPRPCTLAYWHRPRFSSGRHGPDETVQAWWRVLQDARAEVVLSGHDHHYERFAPKRGLRQFVVGTGGRSLYQMPRKVAGTQVRRNDVYGILELELAPTSYSWRFVAVGEKTIDRGSARCST